MNPVTIEIKPRPVNLEFPASVSRFWYDNSPIKSHLFDALSTTLPVGEDLFIFTVRQIRDQITDPQLQKQISAFIGQEAFHSREHAKYNNLMRQWGYDIDKMDRSMNRVTRVLRNRLAPLQALAVTVSCEHLTAILAAAALRGDVLANADPHVKSLWLWHAAEEIEHKSVAWNAYHEIGGSYRTRVIWMNLAITLFSVRISARILHMLRKDGLLFSWKTWREGLNFIFGKGGFLSLLAKDFKDFYRRDFHPDQHDTQPLVDQWNETYVAGRAFPAPASGVINGEAIA